MPGCRSLPHIRVLHGICSSLNNALLDSRRLASKGRGNWTGRASPCTIDQAAPVAIFTTFLPSRSPIHQWPV
jgi:hypothetical protein